MHASTGDARGFTLLEVLVALLVLAGLAASFWGFFAATERVRAHQADYLEAQAEALRVWRVLQEDLRGVRMGSGVGPMGPEPGGLAAFELPEVKDTVEFKELPKGYDFMVLDPVFPGGQRHARLGCRAEARHGTYEKLWKLKGGLWDFNPWPSWFANADDDLPPRGLDPGLMLGALRSYEKSLERTVARPRRNGEADSGSIVVALATVRGPVFWVWHRYDKDGAPLRRLLRVLPDGTQTLVSQGRLTAFDVRPVVEVVAHPGDQGRAADLRKLLFEVRLEATAEERGRALDARTFALATVVSPVVALQQPYWRWLAARR